MKKIIRLTESDLTRIVKRVINEEPEESKEFVVTNNTSVDELESYLNQKTEDYYSYGSENTLIEIVNNLVRNSLLSSGKSEEESESMANDFTERRMDSYSTDIEDKYDSYGRRTEGKNKFNGETIFIFDCGGDGYGFSGFFKNLTGLLEGIKKLLNGEEEEEDLTESYLTRIVRRVINEESMDCSKLKVIPKWGIKGLTTNGKPQSPTWNEDIRKIGNATTVYFFEGSKVDAINTQRKCYRAKKEVTYLEFKRNDGTSYVMIGVD